MLRDLAAGVIDVARGAVYISRHRAVWKWVLAPLVVVAIVAATLLGWIVAFLGATGLVGWASLALGSATLIATFAILVAGPFNELLSETIEEIESGVPPPKMTFSRFCYELAVGIAHAIRRYVPYVLLVIALWLVAHVVPFIGHGIATVGSIWLTARYASYASYDSLWARRHWRYHMKWDYLRARRWRTLGLGAFVGVLLAVPGVNVIAFAIGSAGATLRMLGEDSRGRVAHGQDRAHHRS